MNCNAYRTAYAWIVLWIANTIQNVRVTVFYVLNGLFENTIKS